VAEGPLLAVRAPAAVDELERELPANGRVRNGHYEVVSSREIRQPIRGLGNA